MGWRDGAESDGAQGSADDLSWLVGTYWYVPTEYLPAMQQVNIKEPTITQVNDQTLWCFTQYSNGYLVGQCAASVDGGDFAYQSIVGSVTPEGSVCLSFTPVGGVSLHPVQGSISIASFIVGQGKMVKHQGEWAFLMQMTGGNGVYNLTHWAYMMQTRPGDQPARHRWQPERGRDFRRLGVTVGASRVTLRVTRDDKDLAMGSAAERMRTMRNRQRAGGMREVRLIVPDTRIDEIKQRLALQVARLSPAAEQDALNWIEQVSEFDEAR